MRRDILAVSTENNGKLDLVVYLVVLGTQRNGNSFSGIGDGGRRLEEDGRGRGQRLIKFTSVIDVAEPDGSYCSGVIRGYRTEQLSV